jgi:sugar phosphate permease
MGLGTSYVFSTFLKPVVSEFGWDRTLFAAFGGPMLLSMALASPLVGDLTDRFGPRRVLAGSALLLAATLACFGAMQSLWQFYATSLLLGVALTGLGDIPVGAVASRWFARSRGLALGFIYTGSNIGGSILPIAAAAVSTLHGWRAALWVLAPTVLAMILPCALWLVRYPRGAERLLPGAEPGEAAQGLDLRAALATRSFWILGFALFAFYFYYLGVIQHLFAYLSDQGFSDLAAAKRYAGAVAMGVLGKLAMGLLADRVPLRTALLANFGLVALASLLLLRADEPLLLYAFLAIHGFAVAAENVMLPLIVADCFGVRHMAQIYGALMFALLPGGALGPVFAGAVFDRLGSYSLAFAGFAALNVLCLLGLGFVKRETA